MPGPRDNQDRIRDQYRCEDGLNTRISIWQPPDDGITPQDVTLHQLRTAAPGSLLEIGCGTGMLAERISTELPSTRVLATDQSSRMVQLTAERSVDAEIVDADALGYQDSTFDAVLGAWMLYHVPDLDHTLAEVRRVLRPGGIFVAITNGDQHTADLRIAAGGGPLITQFSTENGEGALRRHFDQVTGRHLRPYAVADHRQAQDYLASFDPDLAANLPPYLGERRWNGAVTVFSAW